MWLRSTAWRSIMYGNKREDETVKKMVRVENLDCANCAAKLERAINKIDGVNEANVNFMAMKMAIDYDEEKYGEIVKGIESAAKKIEPDCVFKGL